MTDADLAISNVTDNHGCVVLLEKLEQLLYRDDTSSVLPSSLRSTGNIVPGNVQQVR